MYCNTRFDAFTLHTETQKVKTRGKATQTLQGANFFTLCIGFNVLE